MFLADTFMCHFISDVDIIFRKKKHLSALSKTETTTVGSGPCIIQAQAQKGFILVFLQNFFFLYEVKNRAAAGRVRKRERQERPRTYKTQKPNSELSGHFNRLFEGVNRLRFS
ncbi:hypothetical protein Droror1_Dr00016114 [Drosera rotundifolia]